MPIVPADLDAATAREAELIARVQAAGRTKILQEELVDQTARLETQLFEDPLTHVHNPSLARVGRWNLPRAARSSPLRSPPPEGR